MSKEIHVTPAKQDDNLKQAYLEAYNLGAKKLCSLDPAMVAKSAQVGYDEIEKSYLVKFLGADYHVSSVDAVIKKDGAESDDVPVTSKVLIAHYLITAQDIPLSGQLISFKELPNGGSIYLSNFNKRALNPIIKCFSQDFDAFYNAAEPLGGKKVPHGHAAVELKIFPKFPVRYVVWQGDEEVPSTGTILFDSTADCFLPVEDIVVAASEGTYAMLKNFKRK